MPVYAEKSNNVSSPDSSAGVRAAGVSPVWGWKAALWVIAFSLATIALCMVLRLDERMLPVAMGQPSGAAGARGVFAFSGQLSDHSYGLYMVDVDAGTMWCYEYMSGPKKLRLVAARSWLYDRYLENQDFDGPSPQEVADMVEAQRLNKLRQRTGATP